MSNQTDDTRPLVKPEQTQESLLHLRDEILKRGIYSYDADIREVLFKINSCLYKEYPRYRKHTA